MLRLKTCTYLRVHIQALDEIKRCLMKQGSKMKPIILVIYLAEGNQMQEMHYHYGLLLHHFLNRKIICVSQTLPNDTDT